MPSHFYQRKLPHFQPSEATFFVIFRLAGSIPMEVLGQLRENYDGIQKGILNRTDLTVEARRKLPYIEQKRFFAVSDEYLDNNPNGPYWLKERAVAEHVKEALHHRDKKQYDLHAFIIMPNHVHMMMTLLPNAPVLYKVMQELKKFIGLNGNRALGRQGQFWEEESYDHVVRNDGAFFRILNYILEKPVKARFVKEWQQWPYSYVHPDLL